MPRLKTQTIRMELRRIPLTWHFRDSPQYKKSFARILRESDSTKIGSGQS
jgi:hypothetical protein